MLVICIRRSLKPAPEKAARRCHREFSAGWLAKSEAPGISRYSQSRQEHPAQANPSQIELYRRSLQFAENIPSTVAAESPKYPCTYSCAAGPGKTPRSSTADARRAPESPPSRENQRPNRRKASAAHTNSAPREKSK